MKYTIVLFLLQVLSNGNAFSQSFEGEIIYENSFESKMQGMSDAQLTSIIGSKQEYYVKEGYYKSIMNGQSIVMQIYDWETNRVYNKMPKSDTLYWFNASTNTDDVISYETKQNVETILGHNCNALILKTRSGTTTFYYSDKYKLDSSKFLNHHYSNWAFYITTTGALPLRIIVESDKFKMTSTAVEIKPMKLQEGFFSIEPQTPIKQSGK